MSETVPTPSLFLLFAFIQACEIHSLLCLKEILKSLILKSEVQSMKYQLLVPALFYTTKHEGGKVGPFHT